MKKLPFLIILLALCACNSNKEKNTTSINEPLKIPIVSNGKSLTSSEREYKDSANFHIIRGNFTSGAKYIEVFENKLTKLDECTEFYENGQVKETGLMINAHHHYVGKWKYYSKTGTLDSIVDYDQKYPVSYFEALKIAEKKGYKMPEIEVTLEEDGSSLYWNIAKWEENELQNGQSSNGIRIDVNSGKVSKHQ